MPLPAPAAEPTARRSRLRGLLPLVVMALLAASLLSVAVVTTVRAGQDAALDDLDHTLASQATADASALQEYFERAESIDLLLANDSAFTQFAPGSGPAPGEETALASAEANDAMAYLERLYPGRISEACLIDATGTEIARVVRGVIAPAEELSTEEAAAPFFAPTMALTEGRVYQAAPYLSADTDEWVISNSTPLVGADGTAWGMVHFEVSLDSFRPEADGRRTDLTNSIVDADTGLVVLETGRELVREELGRQGSPEVQQLAQRAGSVAGARAGAVASATIDGQRLAVVRVPAQPDNANAWAVVASAPISSAGWSRSIGPAPVAMALGALVLLALAAMNLRAGHRELKAASLTDDLTGLPNRRLLDDRMEQALLIGHRTGTSSAVLIIDLDRFKEVNDTMGHHHGDRLLCAVADRLADAFRASDTVARLGGDEFAVLLLDVKDEAAAVGLARDALTLLHEPFTVDGLVLNVEASVGLAMAPHHGRDAEALLRAADVAMYEAKRRKTGVVVYDRELDDHSPQRLALLGDLRRALHEGELSMHYQPKVALGTDEVHSVEALVRWEHPTRGPVRPDEFIPVAEGTGLILPLTMHTLDLALGQARTWLDAGRPLQVAVNLSARCLLELDFPSSVVSALARHGVPAHLLRLELTESAVMADPARALSVLAALQRAGISLSIDDFGTGYSSMAYLKRLPVDELKIDRSFITDMLADTSDGVLVRSSIDLGHNLGLSVVAEGVEDEETAAALRQLGCDVVQGYHLARPMVAEALTQWLASRDGGEVLDDALEPVVASEPEPEPDAEAEPETAPEPEPETAPEPEPETAPGPAPGSAPAVIPAPAASHDDDADAPVVQDDIAPAGAAGASERLFDDWTIDDDAPLFFPDCPCGAHDEGARV